MRPDTPDPTTAAAGGGSRGPRYALTPPGGSGPAGTHPTVELGELLHDYQLGLVLIAGATDDAASRALQWVHVSELEDPTPFLPPRTVLLTTGARLSQHDRQEDADAYVARLVEAGATALGIAVGLNWDRVPPIFVEACDRLGLPLFRVPYDTAFISIVQAAARLLDARIHARDAWLLHSQRAVAQAALHRDGIAAAVREAAARLGKWVAIADRSGRLIEFAPRSARAEADTDRLRREARRLVLGGVRAGRSLAAAGQGAQMQTLGPRGHLLGVLAVQGGAVPDRAEQTLLGLVAALATVQLEHRHARGSADAALRGAILRLLVAGETGLAAGVSAGLLPRLPRGDVLVMRFDPGADDEAPAFLDDLRSLEAGGDGMLLAAWEGDAVLLCEAARLPQARRVLQQHGVAAGVSSRGAAGSLPLLLEQAAHALRRAHDAGASEPLDYSPGMSAGVLRLLDRDASAVRRSEALLAPLVQHDERGGEGLVDGLAAWLRHHGQTSAAAAELGVHRHTLRARVQTAASLLHLDLDDAEARAELIVALRLAGAGPTGRE